MAELETRYHQVLVDGGASQPVAGKKWFKMIVAAIGGCGLVLLAVFDASLSSSTLQSATTSTSLVGLTSPRLRFPQFAKASQPMNLPHQQPKQHLRAVVTQATPDYKLCYFDIRGVAETARMLFAISKTPFEDKRFTIKMGIPGNFSTIERPEFDAAKSAGELDCNLGKAPYLEVDGKKVGQSKAIERYLAKQFGLFGADDLEAAVIDQLCEHVVDFRNAYMRARSTQGDEAKAAATKKFFDETLPTNMKLFEKSLPAGESGPFLLGKQVTLADVNLYQFVAAPGGAFDNQFSNNKEEAKASFENCPRIKAAMEAVAAIPELKAHIAERPERPF